LAARGASLARVLVRGGRLTGLALAEARVRDATIRDCRADLATFAAATLERTAFDGCLLAQADFRDARLDSVVFRDCDLTGADFTGARMRHVELRGCRLDGVAGMAALRGAAMPFDDVVASAPAFADALGIRILDR
ncbi:MAG TPA: pentapeptide repeat-containing protein, partial [Solirubrobacteraceae bacterium]|nr:pentapeptide repeat-containing protein [Solirubrobacteraceae bacterium]